jgi:hypothetical protein
MFVLSSHQTFLRELVLPLKFFTKMYVFAFPSGFYMLWSIIISFLLITEHVSTFTWDVYQPSQSWLCGFKLPSQLPLMYFLLHIFSTLFFYLDLGLPVRSFPLTFTSDIIFWVPTSFLKRVRRFYSVFY